MFAMGIGRMPFLYGAIAMIMFGIVMVLVNQVTKAKTVIPD